MAKEIVIKTKVEGGEDIKKVSNAYSDLVKQIKVAKGELAGLSDKVGTDAYKKAAANLNELQEKLGDVQDAAKITGSGFERVSASFNLLKEGIVTADFGKAKTAFTALGSAMKAIPVFLLIEGIKLLIENFDAVVSFIESFTAAGEANAKAIRELNLAYQVVVESLKEIDFYEKEYVRNSEQRNALLIEQLKQKGAKDKEIRDAETKGVQNKLAIIQKAEENYRQQRDYAEAQYYKALKTDNEEVIKNAKTALENADAAYKTSIDKRKDLSNSLALKEQQNINATLKEQQDAYKEYLKNQTFINDKIKQLQYERYIEEKETEAKLVNAKYELIKKNLADQKASATEIEKIEQERISEVIRIEKEKELELTRIKYEGIKKELKDKKATNEQLKIVDNDYIIEKTLIESKYNQEKIKQLKAVGDLLEKQNVENADNLEKLQKEFDKKSLEEQLKFAQLKGQKTYSIERQILLQKHADELTLMEQQKQKEIDTAKKLAIGAEEEILAIEEKYAKLHNDVKERQYKEEEKLLEKSVDAVEKAEAEKTKKIVSNVNQIVGAFTQLANQILAIFQELENQEEAKREIAMKKLETDLEEKTEKIQDKRDEDLRNVDSYYNSQIEANQASLDAQLENENLTEEEKQALREAAAEREKNLKIKAENEKLQIKYEADVAEYQANVAKYEQEEELKHKAFEQAKKLKAAEIVINTISGAMAAYQAMVGIPYVGPVLAIIAAAAVAALGATQLASLEATRYQKGTAPKAPKPPSYTPIGGGATGQGSTGSKTIKDSTLYGTGGVGGAGKPEGTPKTNVVVNDGKPIQAYVLASDVSDALAAQQALKAKNTGF